MNTIGFFMESYQLPGPLDKKETSELLGKIKEGDEDAKAKLVEHNIRLVIYEVKTKFLTVEYSKSELVAIGIIGLMKAIYSFDISKNVNFPTYATVCIDNEIRMFLRKIKKDEKTDSLQRAIYTDAEGDELRLEDVLYDDNDLLENYTTEETYYELRLLINNLPEGEQEVIKMKFGFYDNRIFTEKEIAEKFHISQSYTSRVIKLAIQKLKIQLQSQQPVKKRQKLK